MLVSFQSFGSLRLDMHPFQPPGEVIGQFKTVWKNALVVGAVGGRIIVWEPAGRATGPPSNFSFFAFWENQSSLHF